MMDYDAMAQALSSFNTSLTNNMNTYLAARTSHEDRNFSREMSEWQWQRNLEAWNMQNDYNLPVNQYARQLQGLKENGLNPNLVYGSSSSVGGAAGAVNPFRFEGYHSTAVPRFGGAEPIQQMLSTRLLQTQVAAQEANNRLLNARATNEEARTPGIGAKSSEASYRWNYIMNNLGENYNESIKANVAKEFWTEQKVEYEAGIAHSKRDIAYYEAAMADWLNTTEIEGLGMTYKQYMEYCKVFLPGAQYARFKADVLNVMSQIAFREKQGELLDLKMVYQGFVNKFAKYGRSLGNNWANLLIAGLEQIFDKHDIFKDFKDWRDRLPVTEEPLPARKRGAMEYWDPDE